MCNIPCMICQKFNRTKSFSALQVQLTRQQKEHRVLVIAMVEEYLKGMKIVFSLVFYVSRTTYI